ncbi:cation transporter [Microvirga arsenatis]|uniref:Cation transporter n=2 Tax=Microvirga arsenatis TaxID=2692265 RepID=A0ABW9YVI5_9HYPH|nr:cation transporter [Microvirga arsenatis]NBJ09475.1 cation transporter [Microvirga arsenatis]NBJ23666.1 cation transporter [Microvirga arsenatis]
MPTLTAAPAQRIDLPTQAPSADRTCTQPRHHGRRGRRGVIPGSLALLADATHNFSGAASVLVSYIAWRISRPEPDRRRTFDYDKLLAELKAFPSVEDVHPLHVWQPDEGRTALEKHVAVFERDLAAVADL